MRGWGKSGHAAMPEGTVNAIGLVVNYLLDIGLCYDAERAFLEALKKPGMSYICEVKKASPSKGLIAPDFPYVEIAKEYEAAGASAISCLTEPFYFMGSDTYLREIPETVDIPVIRKDLTVD